MGYRSLQLERFGGSGEERQDNLKERTTLRKPRFCFGTSTSSWFVVTPGIHCSRRLQVSYRWLEIQGQTVIFSWAPSWRQPVAAGQDLNREKQLSFGLCSTQVSLLRDAFLGPHLWTSRDSASRLKPEKLLKAPTEG